ncbi:MAG: CopG family transcriptional regulator [Archangium sp.]|nr:CopG family transcriptional regulator [Archangium sp.]
MNFSVHIDDELSRELAKLVKRLGVNRNAFIAQAIRQAVEQHQRLEWPRELLDAEPIDVEPFESHRGKARGVRFP